MKIKLDQDCIDYGAPRSPFSCPVAHAIRARNHRQRRRRVHQETKRMRNRVWIVEIDFGDGKRFRPTVGIGLTREDGRRELKEWKSRNPYDAFRLRRYEATGDHLW